MNLISTLYQWTNNYACFQQCAATLYNEFSIKRPCKLVEQSGNKWESKKLKIKKDVARNISTFGSLISHSFKLEGELYNTCSCKQCLFSAMWDYKSIYFYYLVSSPPIFTIFKFVPLISKYQCIITKRTLFLSFHFCLLYIYLSSSYLVVFLWENILKQYTFWC